MRFSEEGLYRALEKSLRAANKPLDCVQLFDKPDVQQHAASSNRVSDYLGNMWRRGLVKRVPVPEPGRGPRWAYMWKDKVPPELGAIGYVPHGIVDRPGLVISEEGDQIQIDLKDTVIIIKYRKPPRAK